MVPQTAEPAEVKQPSPEPPPYDPRQLNLYKLSSLIYQARQAISEEVRKTRPA